MTFTLSLESRGDGQKIRWYEVATIKKVEWVRVAITPDRVENRGGVLAGEVVDDCAFLLPEGDAVTEPALWVATPLAVASQSSGEVHRDEVLCKSCTTTRNQS